MSYSTYLSIQPEILSPILYLFYDKLTSNRFLLYANFKKLSGYLFFSTKFLISSVGEIDKKIYDSTIVVRQGL